MKKVSSLASAAASRSLPRRGGMVGGLFVCLILLGVVGAVGYKFFLDDSDRATTKDLITAEAVRGPFDHIVLEQGEIESSSNKVVVCEVESRGTGGTSILWVIDEGARVEKGDKLVELDSSQLELSLKEKRIRVIAAESAVATAEAQVLQAKIARIEYLEGVFETDRKLLQSEMAVAEQNLTKAKLALDSTDRLVAKGLIDSLQLQADEYAVQNAKNQLESAKQKLKVLEKHTKDKMLVQFDSDIDAAEASLSAAQSELIEEQQELQELEDQISKCVILSPSDGVVVHANRYSSRGGNAEFVVEAGATVRERQEIIKLPDPSAMQVKCKINESRITLIREGMPARIAVDALPDLQLTGRVTKVNRYAEPSSFFSSSIKEYATLIEVIDPPDTIRTGMTAEVQVFVEQLDNALQVPIQALYEHGKELYCLVKVGPRQFETREVQVNATNDTMAAIDEGLSEGDTVVLNLRDHLTLMDLPELERQDNSEMRQLAREREGKAGGPSESREGGPPRGGPGGVDGPSDGGGRPGGGQGGPGEGGPGGGGRFNPAMIVDNIMDSTDTDGDGKISSEEMSAAEGQRGELLRSADKDGDGAVTRAEVLQTMQERRQQRSGGGGPRQGGGPGQ